MNKLLQNKSYVLCILIGLFAFLVGYYFKWKIHISGWSFLVVAATIAGAFFTSAP